MSARIPIEAKAVNSSTNYRLEASSVFGPVQLAGRTVLIVAGPWLLSILALAIISVALELALGRYATEDLRLAVVYSLCLAPLSGGPVGVVTAHLMKQARLQDASQSASGYFLGGLVLSGTVTALLATALCLFLGNLSTEVGIAFISLSIVATLMWTSLSVLSAFNAHRYLFLVFMVGMLICLVAAFFAARIELQVSRLIWAFASGMAFCVAMSIGRILGGDGQAEQPPGESMKALLKKGSEQKYLVLGILLAFCGVWIDKWVVWFGPFGEETVSGFKYFGRYDSILFFAHLSIIPTFALMHSFQTGALAKATTAVRSTLETKKTLASVHERVRALVVETWNNLFQILLIQASITAALVFTAPVISQWAHFDLSQLLMLRVAFLAVFVYSIFYLCAAILIYCGRHRLFLIVQLIFLVVNLLASAGLMLTSGPSVLGVFIASAVAATIAFLLAYRSLQSFDYIMLIGENDGLFTQYR